MGGVARGAHPPGVMGKPPDGVQIEEIGSIMDSHLKYISCVSDLKKFVEDAHATDVVIGLSGGVDSALVATMAVDAFGPEHVHGVLLPGPYSTEHASTDALTLAGNLGIETMTFSIKGAYEAFAAELKDACGDAFEGTTSQNIQARCRMVCLMALSNAHGWLLLNTGNKSEASMGYATLYGDMAGAYAPIGALYKTDVYMLSRWRNEQAAAAIGQAHAALYNQTMLGLQPLKKQPIPRHTINKPASAELAPDQTDEDSLGIEYVTLDNILVAHVERGKDVDALLEAGFAQEDIDLVLAKLAASAFKKALLPPTSTRDFYGAEDGGGSVWSY